MKIKALHHLQVPFDWHRRSSHLGRDWQWLRRSS